MLALFVAANIVRWWVIRTLGEHWNVQVMDSTKLGVITTGPFRYVRHPNYAAVFVEMIALPLIHTAWMTALVGAIAHARRSYLPPFRRRTRSGLPIRSTPPPCALKPRSSPACFSPGPNAAFGQARHNARSEESLFD